MTAVTTIAKRHRNPAPCPSPRRPRQIGRVDAQQKEPRDSFVEVQVLRVRSRPRPEHHVGDDPRVVDPRDHVQKQGGTGGEHDRVRGDGRGPSAHASPRRRLRRRTAARAARARRSGRRRARGPRRAPRKRPDQSGVRRGRDTRRPEGHERERQRGKRADNWQRQRRHQQDGLFIVAVDQKRVKGSDPRSCVAGKPSRLTERARQKGGTTHARSFSSATKARKSRNLVSCFRGRSL